jgi:hypothetical protein
MERLFEKHRRKTASSRFRSHASDDEIRWHARLIWHRAHAAWEKPRCFCSTQTEPPMIRAFCESDDLWFSEHRLVTGGHVAKREANISSLTNA